jgi:hypothetical protein
LLIEVFPRIYIALVAFLLSLFSEINTRARAERAENHEKRLLMQRSLRDKSITSESMHREACSAHKASLPTVQMMAATDDANEIKQIKITICASSEQPAIRLGKSKERAFMAYHGCTRAGITHRGGGGRQQFNISSAQKRLKNMLSSSSFHSSILR